jgi:hypothetical protein
VLVIMLLLIALAVVGPLFGADTRDGRNWTSDNASKLS